jgi:hypothetical protein
MATAMRMLGVRVPADSDIPDRLKARSLETRMAYYELIDRWLDRDAREEAAGLNPANPDTGMTPQGEEPVNMSSLEARLTEMQTAIVGDVKTLVSSMIDERLSRITEERTAKPQEEKDETPKPEERRPVDRIKELQKAGVSLRGIADTLNKEGIPTIVEGGSWNHTAVKRMLDKS